MTNPAIATTGTNSLEATLRLQEMNIEELAAEAKRLGVQLTTTDKSVIIDQLIQAGASVADAETETAPGTLFSLHSQTDDAKAFIRSARSIIVENQQNGVNFNLFLQRQDKARYVQRAPGVKMTRPESIARALNLVTLLPDGSQNTLFAEYKAKPEAFKPPVLVLLRRRNSDGGFANYVMLYLERKPEDVTEKTL